MADSAKKILVVDDEPDAVAGVTAMLQAGGYEVCSAANGEEGLAAARERNPDLILLDLQMPVKDGFETFGDLKQDDALKSIPVVFLTGIGGKTKMGISAEMMGEILGSEPEGYLEKPVDPDHLVRTIRGVLGG